MTRKCPKCRAPVRQVQDISLVTQTYDVTGVEPVCLSGIESAEPLRKVYGICECGHEWRLRGVTGPADLCPNPESIPCPVGACGHSAAEHLSGDLIVGRCHHEGEAGRCPCGAVEWRDDLARARQEAGAMDGMPEDEKRRRGLL